MVVLSVGELRMFERWGEKANVSVGRIVRSCAVLFLAERMRFPIEPVVRGMPRLTKVCRLAQIAERMVEQSKHRGHHFRKPELFKARMDKRSRFWNLRSAENERVMKLIGENLDEARRILGLSDE